jgi:hypothetical protein
MLHGDLKSWRAPRCPQPKALTVVSAPDSSNPTCLSQSSGSLTALAAGAHIRGAGRSGQGQYTELTEDEGLRTAPAISIAHLAATGRRAIAAGEINHDHWVAGTVHCRARSLPPGNLCRQIP